MRTKSIFQLYLIYTCFILINLGCQSRYDTTIKNISPNKSKIIAFSREDVNTEYTIKVELSGKDSYQLYKKYKVLSTKRYKVDENITDIEFRTSIIFYKNKKLIDTIFIKRPDLVIFGYSNEIVRDSSFCTFIESIMRDLYLKNLKSSN